MTYSCGFCDKPDSEHGSGLSHTFTPRPVNADSRVYSEPRDALAELIAELRSPLAGPGGQSSRSIADAIRERLLVLDPADEALPDRITRAIDEALRASPVGLVWDHDQTLTFYGVIVRAAIKAALAGDPS